MALAIAITAGRRLNTCGCVTYRIWQQQQFFFGMFDELHLRLLAGGVVYYCWLLPLRVLQAADYD